MFASGDGFAYHSDNNDGMPVFFKTKDFGQTWTPMVAPPFRTTGVIRMGTAKIGYGLGYGGDLFKTTDGGAAWREIRGPKLPRNSFASFDGFAVAVGGRTLMLGATVFLFSGGFPKTTTLFISDDSGASWRRTDLPFTGSVFAIRFLNTRDALIDAVEYKVTRHADGSYQGDSIRNAIYITHDGGRTMRALLSCPHAPVVRACTAVGMATKTRYFVGRNDGSLLMTTNDGRSFKALPSLVGPVHPDALSTSFWVAGVAFADPKHGFASTNGGGTWRTTDGGLTWTSEVSPQQVWGVGIGDLAVADSEHAIVGGPNFVYRRVP